MAELHDQDIKGMDAPIVVDRSQATAEVAQKNNGSAEVEGTSSIAELSAEPQLSSRAGPVVTHLI